MEHFCGHWRRRLKNGTVVCSYSGSRCWLSDCSRQPLRPFGIFACDACVYNAVRCLERCPRTKKGCEHDCPRPCGDLCEPKWQVVLFDIPLPCDHIARQLRCHEAQTLEKVRCQVQMEQVMKHCKHKIRVRGHELPLNVDYPCSAICGAALICGHNCTHTCKDCNNSID